MTRSISFRFSACVLLLGTALLVSQHGKLSAADPNFVGVLAMAVEDEGIKRLELSEETLEKLLAFIGQREEKVVNLVQQIRGLSPAEQEAKLRPFREESEKLAMQLLTVAQREILNQMRVASKGMDSLIDPQVTAVLTLTKEQQESIKKLMAQLAITKRSLGSLTVPKKKPRQQIDDFDGLTVDACSTEICPQKH